MVLAFVTSMCKCFKACISVYKHIKVYAKRPSPQVTASLKQRNLKHSLRYQDKGEYA